MPWTTKQAAEFLKVTPTYVTILCKRGKLKAEMHGRDWDIDPESVRVYQSSPKNKGGRPRKSPTSQPENSTEKSDAAPVPTE
jgi:excisionase family DNA binding protein